MSSRLADSMALVERCKRAGWEVDRGKDGYRVKLPGGGIQGIHLTYSDVRSINVVIRALEAAGLSEAEAAVKKSRLTETRTRAQIAAEAAEKRAQELSANASIQRAAGPYLIDVEDVDINWFVTPHPAPWMRWVNITPQIARKLLADHNDDNRPVNKVQVKFYRDVILNGLWHLTHQGIAIDTRARVQDGQHRMHGILAATESSGHDVIVPFAVFVGMPVENFKTIDEGMLRNARQLFGKAGEKNAAALQTCVRLVHYAGDPDARRSARLKLPNQVVVDEFGADADEFREVIKLGMRDYAKVHCGAGALAAAMYRIRRVNGRDNEYVGQFYDGLTTGRIPGTRMVLDDDDPRQVLRDRFQSLKIKGESRTALTQMGMIIATWNNCITNRRVRVLHFNDEQAIPNPLKCVPGQGYRPDVFGTLVTGTGPA